MRSYLRRLTENDRTPLANRHLAFYLTFVAGAVNAGGFLAVGQYTSHMSGIVSGIADNVALARWPIAFAGVGSVLAFLSGAATSAWLINWGRRSERRSIYALPLIVEAAALMTFAVMGPYAQSERWMAMPLTVFLLCYSMGLQNAMITKLSRAEIRTTHVTGLITDLGIELGRLGYWNRNVAFNARGRVVADRLRLRLLSGLTLTFLIGGIIGALGFKTLGFVTALPLAVVLFALGAVPVSDDLRGLRDPDTRGL